MRAPALRVRPILHLLCFSAAAAACGGGGGTGTDNKSAAVRVAMNTGGFDLDADGYQVSVGKNTPVSIGTNSTQIVGDLTGTTVAIQIDGVAGNCGINGTNPRTVSLTPGDTTDVIFLITCQSTKGTIVLANTTTGPAVGYTVAYDGQILGLMYANTSVRIDSVPKGPHTIDIFASANCALSGSSSRPFTIVGGDTAQIDYSATCAALPTLLGFPFTDPAGDTINNPLAVAPKAIDLVSIAGDYTASGLTMTLHFSGPVQGVDANAANSVTGYLELDLDESLATGDTAFVNYDVLGANSPIGWDAIFWLFGYSGGQMKVYYDDGADSSLAAATFSGDSLVIVVPDSVLRDDGNFIFDAVLGTAGANAHATDLAPNLGYYTARKPPLSLLSLSTPWAPPPAARAARRASFLRTRLPNGYLGARSLPTPGALPLHGAPRLRAIAPSGIGGPARPR